MQIKSKKKKIIYWFLSILLLISTLLLVVGCNTTRINVISRDSASGTRSTFDSFIGIEKVRKDASFLNSNGMILSCVNRDRRAIGYVSYKSYISSREAFNNVKAIALDGKTIQDKDYALGHTLNLIYKDTIVQSNSTLKSFLMFIDSEEANKIIAEEGYITGNTNVKPFERPTITLTENIIIGGSTSIEPLMQKLRERFLAIVGGQLKGKIEIQGGGSSKGINDVKSGAFQLGMSSRELSTDEKEGVNVKELAKENIVIVVNTKNPIDELTRWQVQQIYSGNMKDWAQFIK